MIPMMTVRTIGANKDKVRISGQYNTRLGAFRNVHTGSLLMEIMERLLARTREVKRGVKQLVHSVCMSSIISL